MFKLDQKEINRIIEDYKKGISANKIGKSIGKDHHFVLKLLHNYDIALRNKSDSGRSVYPYVETDKKFGNHRLYQSSNGGLFYFGPFQGKLMRHYVVEENCSVCGIKCIKTKNKRIRKVCSRKCQNRLISGTNNCNWKGDRKFKSTGYILKYAPDHPFAVQSFVPEHRLVMENVLGRYLSRSEVVHHINGIKTDNRPENLSVCTQKEHTVSHNSLLLLVHSLLERNIIYFDTTEKIYKLIGDKK